MLTIIVEIATIVTPFFFIVLETAFPSFIFNTQVKDLLLHTSSYKRGVSGRIMLLRLASEVP